MKPLWLRRIHKEEKRRRKTFEEVAKMEKQITRNIQNPIPNLYVCPYCNISLDSDEVIRIFDLEKEEYEKYCPYCNNNFKGNDKNEKINESEL